MLHSKTKNKNHKAFTLVELIITMVIIGVLSAAGISFFAPFINLFFFTPAQLQTEYLANRIIDGVIEGNYKTEGLNTAKDINYATAETLIYTNNNDELIWLEWDQPTKMLLRTLPLGTKEVFPSNQSVHLVKVEGNPTPEVIFKYYNSQNQQLPLPIADLQQLSRIEMDWVVYTGTSNKRQTQYKIITGVHIKKGTN